MHYRHEVIALANVCTISGALLLAGCGDSGGGSGTSAAGGSQATGGSGPAVGGAGSGGNALGGSTAIVAGGTTSITGGTTSITGGSTASGGSTPVTGGTTASGGTPGSTGGTPGSTGGTPGSTGGTPGSTGGTPGSTGGAAGTATTGGAAGTATTGGAAGTATTGGAAGTATTGGAAGTATTGGAAGTVDPGIEGPLTPEGVWREVRRINDYWILDHENPGSNEWDRATYFSANMAAYEILGDEDYRSYSRTWAEGHGYGLNGGTNTRHADNHCAGQTYIALYEADPSQDKIAAISSSIDRMVNGGARDDWWWIDAMHMAMPVFARLATLQDNGDRYRQVMYEFFDDAKSGRGLYNQGDGLWYRDDSFKPPNRTPSGADVYWSRGNGWVFAALAKILPMLPENDPHRAEYITVFTEMAEALRDAQQPDGFYYTSLHDPTQLGGPESSGTGFFTYGMAWGMRYGLLELDRFLPSAVASWEALNEVSVHPNGRVGYCQRIDVGPGPSSYDDNTDYGVGAFVLAGLALYELALDEGWSGGVPEQIAPLQVDSFSAEQAGNEARFAVDGSILTRWSASGFPQSITVDLGEVRSIDTVELQAYENRAYRYTVSASTDGTAYETVVDQSGNDVGGKNVNRFDPTGARYLKVDVTGSAGNGGEWMSVSDIRVFAAP